MRRLLVFIAAMVLLVGCAPAKDATEPPSDLPRVDEAAAKLATALSEFDVSGVLFVHAAADAQADLVTITQSFGKLRPKVRVGDISYDGAARSSRVALIYEFPDIGWRYAAAASFSYVGSDWRTAWAPSIVHPDLTELTRLKYTRTMPKRAPINGSDGLAIVEDTPVVRIGLDKANLDPSLWEASAHQLATILGVDGGSYAARVKASGPKAFVIAKTVRKGDLPEAVANVAGIYLQDATAMMGPTQDFASGLLGVTGEATAEIIEKGNGEVKEFDIVGLTGLQQRHDKQLRGTAGHKVELVARPQPSPAPTPSGSPTPALEAKMLHEKEPVPGEPLNLSLNVESQLKAESILANVKGVASLVVIKPSTGEVLAMANSPESGANPYANTGRYAPGSTFKVVTSLALLRKGFTPNTTVNCPAKYTVSGYGFANYDNYPSSALGSIPLSKAFSASCNTAFMTAGEKLTSQDITDAAASLGLGVDYNPGFASFYGSVPVVNNSIAKAGSTIGQAQVEASPMSMAGVVASVASGKTVVPWMVKGQRPEPKASPLTEAESSTLRGLMAAVVNGGTAQSLKGVVDGAKTGTAQFGAKAPYKYHAWLVAWKGDVAVAAFVYDGVSGSTSAAPLVKEFFS